MMFRLGFLILVLIGCNRKTVDNEFDLFIYHKGDTITSLRYEENPKYEIYNSAEGSLVFDDPNNLKMIPGQFELGIMSRIDKRFRFLTFLNTQDTLVTLPESILVPCLGKELFDTTVYKAEVFDNYVDTTANPHMKYEIYVVLDRKTSDTLLFQETSYFRFNGQVFTSLIVYDDQERKEEMWTVVQDMIAAVKNDLAKFVTIEFATEFEGKVKSVANYKGQGYLKMTDGNRYLVPNRTNPKLTPSDLSEFLERGDFLKKARNSDDFVIVRGNQKFEFLNDD